MMSGGSAYSYCGIAATSRTGSRMPACNSRRFFRRRQLLPSQRGISQRTSSICEASNRTDGFDVVRQARRITETRFS